MRLPRQRVPRLCRAGWCWPWMAWRTRKTWAHCCAWADGAGVDGVVLTERRTRSAESGCREGQRRSIGAFAHCAGGKPGARIGRPEAQEFVDHRPGRARNLRLTINSTFRRLRAGAGTRGRGTARPGAPHLPTTCWRIPWQAASARSMVRRRERWCCTRPSASAALLELLAPLRVAQSRLPRLNQRNRKAGFIEASLCRDSGCGCCRCGGFTFGCANQHGPAGPFRGKRPRQKPRTRRQGRLFALHGRERPKLPPPLDHPRRGQTSRWPVRPLPRMPTGRLLLLPTSIWTCACTQPPSRSRCGRWSRCANDGKTPLACIPLQISSSLSRERVRLNGKDVAFQVATLNSDSDHTGQLHEAAIPLAQPLAPGASLQLDVTYSGVVAPSAQRLLAIGTPEDVALHSDWDRIGVLFTGLRGFGNVVWYPAASVPVISGRRRARFRRDRRTQGAHGRGQLPPAAHGGVSARASAHRGSDQRPSGGAFRYRVGALDQTQEVAGVATANLDGSNPRL